MPKYEVSRRILVRRIGLRTSEIVEGLVSGPCKRRTATEQSENLAAIAEKLSALAEELAALDANAPPEV